MIQISWCVFRGLTNARILLNALAYRSCQIEKDLSAVHEKLCLLELSLRKIKFVSPTH